MKTAFAGRRTKSSRIPIKTKSIGLFQQASCWPRRGESSQRSIRSRQFYLRPAQWRRRFRCCPASPARTGRRPPYHSSKAPTSAARPSPSPRSTTFPISPVLQQVSDLPGPDGRVSFREAVTAANNTPGPRPSPSPSRSPSFGWSRVSPCSGSSRTLSSSTTPARRSTSRPRRRTSVTPIPTGPKWASTASSPTGGASPPSL